MAMWGKSEGDTCWLGGITAVCVTFGLISSEMLDFIFQAGKVCDGRSTGSSGVHGDKPAGSCSPPFRPRCRRGGCGDRFRQRRPTSRGFLLLLPLTAGSLQSRDVYSLAQSVLHVFISAVQPCSAPCAACLTIRRVSHHFLVPGSPNSSHSSEHG